MKVNPTERIIRLYALVLLSSVICVACAYSNSSDDKDGVFSDEDRNMAVGSTQWVEQTLQAITGRDCTSCSVQEQGSESSKSGKEAKRTPLPLSRPSSDKDLSSIHTEGTGQASVDVLPFMLQSIGKKQAMAETVPKKASEKVATSDQIVSSKKTKLSEKAKKQPKIAILIDDLGYSHQGMNSALQLPTQVTLAILPMTPFAHQTAVRSKEQDRPTMLHAPMENERELKLGPGGLYVKMTEKELKAALIKDLDSLPGVKGVNNHMGSLLTANQQSMDWVMQVLKQRHLFFIDSLTSSQSVAGATAKRYGLRTTTRNIFLDNVRTEKAIDHQFTRLLKVARKKGQALAIGHPYPETMAYLKKRLNNLGPDHVTLVPLSALLTPASSMPEHKSSSKDQTDTAISDDSLSEADLSKKTESKKLEPQNSEPKNSDSKKPETNASVLKQPVSE